MGMPTPTGTDFDRLLPQVPMPSSRARSLPTMETYLRASGPLPTRVAPADGRGDDAVFDEVGLGGGEDELAVGDVDLSRRRS